MVSPTFRYVFDEAHVEAYQRGRRVIVPAAAWASWILLGATFVMAGLGALSWRDGSTFEAGMALVGSVVALAGMVLVAWIRRMARTRTRESPLWQRSITVTLSEAGLHESCQGYQATHPWTHFVSAHWFEDGLVLNGALWLPYAALQEGTPADVRAVVEGRVRTRRSIARTLGR